MEKNIKFLSLILILLTFSIYLGFGRASHLYESLTQWRIDSQFVEIWLILLLEKLHTQPLLFFIFLRVFPAGGYSGKAELFFFYSPISLLRVEILIRELIFFFFKWISASEAILLKLKNNILLVETDALSLKIIKKLQ